MSPLRVGIDEGARLQFFDRPWNGSQRNRGEGHAVRQQTPYDAVRQWIEAQPEKLLRPKNAGAEQSRWFRQVSRQLAVGRGIGVEERL
jgi:hypothetical protein